jgi:hypothetical protein
MGCSSRMDRHEPEIDWDTLSDEPRELRLLTGAEVDALCSANLVTQVELDALPPRQGHLRAIQTPRAQLFSDYLRLRGPTGSGAMFISRAQMQKPAAVNLPMIATWIFTRNWKTICS